MFRMTTFYNNSASYCSRNSEYIRVRVCVRLHNFHFETVVNTDSE